MKNTAIQDVNVLFDINMQPVISLSPNEYKLKQLEEKFKTSALRSLAPTRDEAIGVLIKKLIQAQKQLCSWMSREYLINNKIISTRYGQTTVYEANKRRRQNNIDRYKNEINEAIRNLKLLGISQTEIQTILIQEK